MPQVLSFGPRGLINTLMSRMQFFNRAGIGVSFNGKRNNYEIFGYPQEITLKDYRDEYERNGIAARIIECYPRATWRTGASLREDEDPDVTTAFEEDWESLDARLDPWSVFQQADILSRLSTYAIILIGTADGALETELPTGNSPDQVIFLQAYSGGGGPYQTNVSSADSSFAAATILEFETNPKEERFGLPLTYQLRQIDSRAIATARTVHWSRVVHLAENRVDNLVYAQPELKSIWNRLIDLEKVTGGGSEAFFQRANAGLNLNLDKDMDMEPEDEKKLAAEVEDYKNNITRIMKTRGMQVTQLGSDVANFFAPADAILTQIAGAKAIPKRILLGSEMGQLASGQDRDNWDTAVQDRRTTYAGPKIVKQLVDRLIDYGYLSAPAEGPQGYDIVWPILTQLTETDKAAGAHGWASTNSTQGETVFTSEEIRKKWYDMEPLDPSQIKQAAPKMPPGFGGAGVPTPKVKDEADELEEDVEPEEPKARAAQDAELLRVLETAIEANNTEVIDAILGITRGEQP